MPDHLFILIIFICWCLPLAAQEIQPPKGIEQKISVYDKEVDFSGWRGPHEDAANVDEIRIGLFFPKNPKDEINSSFIKSAELAIEEINNNGGYYGLPYRLIRRSSDDPWGAGSKEMIKLIYEDSVWAVIGSQNGAASHIAEQIVTKAFLPLISPISADPTLNYIRIPWIFRLPPDYQSQASLIVNKGIIERSIKRVGLISSTNHDGRTFSIEVQEALKELNQSPIFHFEIPDQELELSDILGRALAFQPDGFIIHLSAPEIVKFVSELQNIDSNIPVFLPWIPDLDIEALSENKKENLYFIDPFSKSKNPEWESFKQRYYKQYGSIPTEGAAFTYDAIYLLMHAIKKAGLNKSAIRDAIVNSDYLTPVTSKILWDNTGGNLIQPVFRNNIAQ